MIQPRNNSRIARKTMVMFQNVNKHCRAHLERPLEETILSNWGQSRIHGAPSGLHRGSFGGPSGVKQGSVGCLCQ